MHGRRSVSALKQMRLREALQTAQLTPNRLPRHASLGDVFLSAIIGVAIAATIDADGHAIVV